MKIDINLNDYTSHGLGFNSFNFNRNILSKLSEWALQSYRENQSMTKQERDCLEEKLKAIVNIINEE